MDNSRKRVLFFARPFPPAPWVASIRTGNIAKYLQMNGWQVEVVTVDPDLLPQRDSNHELDRLKALGVKIRYTDYNWAICSGSIRSSASMRWPIFSRIILAVMRILCIDDGFGWVGPAVAACRDIRPGEVDLILASGSPFFSFQIARRVARRLQCPYALDYRDLWSRSPHYKPFWPQRILERCWIKDASKLFFVSWGCLEEMARWVGSSDKMSVITNGFDQEAMAGVEGLKEDRPIIVYAGRFYPPESTPAPILKALQLLQCEGDCPQFHYYGPHNDLVEAEAKKLGVLHFIVLHGITERTAVLKAIKQARVAVVVTTVKKKGTISDRGIVTAKIFEPLGLRTPVLLIAPECSDARAILEESEGGRAFSGDDVEGISAFLGRICRGQERFSFAGVDRFSWQMIGCRLSDALTKIRQKKVLKKVSDK
jgi:glycosyltransferase involved in cell wall biosynthesis